MAELTALLDRIEALEKKATGIPWGKGGSRDPAVGDRALANELRNNLPTLLRAARFGVEARKFISHVHGCAYLCEGGMKCHASHACDCGYEALLLELALLAKMTEEG